MARVALRPLTELAAASRTIAIENLPQRLPVRGAGDELDAVATAFNDTLARLEESIGEMRQFSVVNGTQKSVRTDLVNMILAQLSEVEGEEAAVPAGRRDAGGTEHAAHCLLDLTRNSKLPSGRVRSPRVSKGSASLVSTICGSGAV